MKILFFASSSIHSVKWIKYFAKQGHQVSWLTLDAIDDKTRQEVGCTIYQFDKPKSKAGRFFKALWSLSKVVDSVKPDIIHVHYIGFYGVLALLQRKAPFVCTAWGSDILINKKNWPKRLLLKAILGRSQRVTCDADHMIREIENLNVPRKQIERINFGIDTAYFRKSELAKTELRQKLGIPADAVVVLSTRNHHPVYDIETIVKSMKVLVARDSRFFLLIAGMGPLTESLKEMVRAEGLDKSVQFYGRYDQQVLKELLALSDVYVSASRSDAGIAASTAEAMAMELPVVISDVCENREWVCFPKEQLFAVGDAADLADKIGKTLSLKLSRSDFEALSRKLIVDHNDYNNEMNKMQLVYAQLGHAQ
jgi:L-malate glycosyltransferase